MQLSHLNSKRAQFDFYLFLVNFYKNRNRIDCSCFFFPQTITSELALVLEADNMIRGGANKR